MRLKLVFALITSFVVAGCHAGALASWDNAPQFGMTTGQVRQFTGQPSRIETTPQGLTRWVYEYDVRVDENGSRHSVDRSVLFNLGRVTGFEASVTTSTIDPPISAIAATTTSKPANKGKKP